MSEVAKKFPHVDEAISDSKIYLHLKQPFIGALSSKLLFEERDDIPTACVDGKTIYYNPSFFEELSMGEVIFVIAHEILHVVYDHIFRRGDRDPLVWNQALDYIVNYTLVKNNIGVMPKNVLYNEKYNDEYTAEELYELLLKDKNLVENYFQIDIHLDPDDSNSNNDKTDNNGNKITVSVKSLTGKPLSEDEIKEIRDSLKATIFTIKSSVAAGNIPAGISRAIERLYAPKINWREVIQNYIKATFKSDFNMRTPSDQSWVSGVLMPRFSYGDCVETHIFIDASGSITDEQLGMFLSEIDSIAKQFESYNITIGTFDTKVYNVKKYSSEDYEDLKKYEVKGGGGTSLTCVFDYLKENNIVPKSLIIFTDGEIPNNCWGDETYCPETLFLINNIRKIKAPYGITIHYE